MITLNFYPLFLLITREFYYGPEKTEERRKIYNKISVGAAYNTAASWEKVTGNPPMVRFPTMALNSTGIINF